MARYISQISSALNFFKSDLLILFPMYNYVCVWNKIVFSSRWREVTRSFCWKWRNPTQYRPIHRCRRLWSFWKQEEKLIKFLTQQTRNPLCKLKLSHISKGHAAVQSLSFCVVQTIQGIGGLLIPRFHPKHAISVREFGLDHGSFADRHPVIRARTHKHTHTHRKESLSQISMTWFCIQEVIIASEWQPCRTFGNIFWCCIPQGSSGRLTEL